MVPLLDAVPSGTGRMAEAAVMAARNPVGPVPRRPAAAETVRLYAGDWAAFAAWCRARGLAALPASGATLAAYLAEARQLSPGTLTRRVAAIGSRHRQSGHPPPGADPAVRAILREVRRTATRRRVAQAAPGQLARMAAACPGSLAGTRDRALLLLAAATGLGRAKLLALDIEHLRFTRAGLDLTLHDDRGEIAGRVAVAGGGDLCPVRALEAWLRVSDTQYGPLFRKVDRWGNVEHRRLRTDAIRRILARRAGRPS